MIDVPARIQKALDELDQIDDDEWDSKWPREITSETLETIKTTEQWESGMRYDAFKELNLRDKGYLVVQTFDENDMDQLLYSYTVGLERSGFPEMISFYPSVNNNDHIFREIYMRMKDGSLTPPCGSEPQDNLIPVADLFGNSDIKIYITSLTSEIKSHAFEHYTKDLPTNTTPVMLVYVPHPSGKFDFNLIPSSLIDDIGQEYQSFIMVMTDYDNEMTARVD